MVGNVKRSQKYNWSQGKYQGLAPLGYLNSRDENKQSKIILDEKRAPIIKKMFEEYATSNHTLKSIWHLARELNLCSRPTKKRNYEAPISRVAGYDILTNPFYYGEMRIKNELMPHIYPPIVSKALFDKVQVVLSGENPKMTKRDYKEMPFAFRGLIRCSTCGCTIIPEIHRKPNGKEYREDNKVRGSHAQRQGQVFSWDNPPEGGHPGEDYGCRCLAVKYIPPFDKNREIAKLEQQISNIQAQIDLKNGNNAAFVERIARIDIELSQIIERIYETSKQGFFDGMEGADEGSGNAAKIADYFRKNPITELENLLAGGISGAAGTAYAEYKYLEQEKLRLERERDSLNNKIDSNSKDVAKLEDEISKLEQQIENIKSS